MLQLLLAMQRYLHRISLHLRAISIK